MKLREKAISMRKAGMSVVDVANALGIHKGTVSVYTGHLGIRVVKPKENKGATKAECFRLYAMGFSPYEIAINLNLTRNTVYQYVRLGNAVKGKYKYDPKNDIELCKALFIDGYPIEQISLLTGLRLSEVRKYTSRHKPHQVKFSMKKKKVKATPSRIEQRAVLGKGIISGTYSLDVKLRPDRDDGVLLGIVYRDLGNVNKDIRIRIKETEDKELKAKNWCKKFGKKYVNYF